MLLFCSEEQIKKEGSAEKTADPVKNVAEHYSAAARTSSQVGMEVLAPGRVTAMAAAVVSAWQTWSIFKEP